MSTSSSDLFQKEVADEIVTNSMPKWLENFFGQTFFEKCEVHGIQKNDINRYCVTCADSLCKVCVTHDNHKDHSILTMYRHVYQDVVLLCEIENSLDCTMIQPYKCNKKWVLSLTPLPHNGSGMLIDGVGACITCKRKLMDPNCFLFCSIACKFNKNTGNGFKLETHGSSISRSMEDAQEVMTESISTRRRKGVPHRAPLF